MTLFTKEFFDLPDSDLEADSDPDEKPGLNFYLEKDDIGEEVANQHANINQSFIIGCKNEDVKIEPGDMKVYYDYPPFRSETRVANHYEESNHEPVLKNETKYGINGTNDDFSDTKFSKSAASMALDCKYCRYKIAENYKANNGNFLDVKRFRCINCKAKELMFSQKGNVKPNGIKAEKIRSIEIKPSQASHRFLAKIKLFLVL